MADDLALQRAIAMMKKAVDRAAEQTNGKASWEDIFGTSEKMQFWLDDRNFEKVTIQ
jgi:hypothetical protein